MTLIPTETVLHESFSCGDIQMVARTVCYAAAPDREGGVLSGLALDITPTMLTATCTNGHLFSQVRSAGTFTHTWSGLIAASRWKHMATRLKRAHDSSVVLSVDADDLMVRTNRDCYQATLMRWMMPDYDRLVAGSPTTTLTVNRSSFMHVLKQPWQYEMIHMTLHPMTASLGISDLDGDQRCDVPTIGQITGTAQQLWINPRLVHTALCHEPSREVVIEILHPERPVLMRGTAVHGRTTALHAVMPMRRTNGGDA